MSIPINRSRPESAPEVTPRSNTSHALAAPVHSVALGPGNMYTASASVRALYNSYAPLAYSLPWEVLDYVEVLATYNADFSQAVDNICTLANSGHELIVDATGVREAASTLEYLQQVSRTVQPDAGGIDGVVDKLLRQASVYGAMAGEWLIDGDTNEVIDFADVNPKSIRFFWDDPTQSYWPYQKVRGVALAQAQQRGQQVISGCIQLNPLTFHYYGFNNAPGSPYGVPPFIAALEPIGIQRDMVANMSQIVKKIGLLGLIDIIVQQLPPKPGESDEQFATRASSYLEEYVTAGEDMVRDGGLVHYDDVTVESKTIAGNATGATSIFKQNEELVFSGLKSMPSVQGRCLDPESRIMLTDGSHKQLRDIAVGDLIQAFDEHTSGTRRRWRQAKVEAVWYARKPAVRLRLSDGRSVTAGVEHPFLLQEQKMARPAVTGRRLHEIGQAAALKRWRGEEYPAELKYGHGWKRAGDIRVGEWIRALDEPAVIDYDSEDYKTGYIAGANAGDGCCRMATAGRHGYWQIGNDLRDEAIEDRIESYCADLGITGLRRSVVHPRPNPLWPNHNPVPMVFLKTGRVTLVPQLIAMHEERDSDEYRAGWLAGLFDTDGSGLLNNGNKPCIRISQNDGAVKDQAKRYLDHFGFAWSANAKCIELLGDRTVKWRFTAMLRPALDRKVIKLDGFTVRVFKPVRVMGIEQLGERDLIDLTTSTGTLIANGLYNHNSYSTTETYAGVAYDIIIRNTKKYQRACKRMIESGYWLAAQLVGRNPTSIGLDFHPNKTLHRLQDAQANNLEIKNAAQKWLAGVTDQRGFAQELGYDSIKVEMEWPPDALVGTLRQTITDQGQTGGTGGGKPDNQNTQPNPNPGNTNA